MPDHSQAIFIAILAAGQSSRYGTTKQIIEFNGVPLVRRAADTAAEVCENRCVTVIGHDRETVFGTCAANTGFVVVNEDYENGLGTSIAAAARACRSHAGAILVLLADQPLVTAPHLEKIIESWSGADDEIVASTYADTQGPPVLFPRGAFAELCSLDSDNGAHALLRDPRFSLKTVSFEPASVDIDTPADLSAVMDRD